MTEPAPRPMRVGELALCLSGQEASLFAQNRGTLARFRAFISLFWPDPIASLAFLLMCTFGGVASFPYLRGRF